MPRPRLPSRFVVAEPSDASMWRSVEATVRDVLLPSIADDWARVIAVQLVGMARYAATRPGDPLAWEVVVDVHGDFLAEGDETFRVVLSNLPGGTEMILGPAADGWPRSEGGRP